MQTIKERLAWNGFFGPDGEPTTLRLGDGICWDEREGVLRIARFDDEGGAAFLSFGVSPESTALRMALRGRQVVDLVQLVARLFGFRWIKTTIGQGVMFRLVGPEEHKAEWRRAYQDHVRAGGDRRTHPWLA